MSTRFIYEVAIKNDFQTFHGETLLKDCGQMYLTVYTPLLEIRSYKNLLCPVPRNLSNVLIR